MASAEPAPPPKPPTKRVCKFAGPPGAGIEIYPLFQTKDAVASGVDVFIKVAKDPSALVQFLGNTGTVLIARDTTCAFEDLGILGSSHVRIASGKHVGRAGWVPTEWVNVEEPVAP